MTGNVVRLIQRLARKPAGADQRLGDRLVRRARRRDADRGRRAASRAFGLSVCGDWERAAVQAERFGVRVVRLRIGLVLGTEGGMLAQLLTPFEYGLGGPIGSGRQWMSWIERDDLVRLIAHAIATPSLTGAGQRDGARAGAQRDLRARARPRAASAGVPAPAGRAAALARRRHGRGAAAGRPARRPREGAEERLRVPLPRACAPRSPPSSAAPDTRDDAVRHAMPHLPAAAKK